MSQVPAAQHMDAHAAVRLAAKGIIAQSTSSPLWLDRTLFPFQGLPQDRAGDVAGFQSCLHAYKLVAQPGLMQACWACDTVLLRARAPVTTIVPKCCSLTTQKWRQQPI